MPAKSKKAQKEAPVSLSKVRQAIEALKPEDRRLARKWLKNRHRRTKAQLASYKAELAKLAKAGLAFRMVESLVGLPFRNGNNAYDLIKSKAQARKASKPKARKTAPKAKKTAKAKPAKQSKNTSCPAEIRAKANVAIQAAIAEDTKVAVAPAQPAATATPETVVTPTPAPALAPVEAKVEAVPVNV